VAEVLGITHMKEQLNLLEESQRSQTNKKDLNSEEKGEEISVKKCDTCKKILSISRFYNNKYKHDGYASTCKACLSASSMRKSKHYNRLLKEQLGLCAICEKTTKENKKDFAVDHCHATGIIRGALCNNCNTGIGLLKEDTEIMKKAIDYLAKYKHRN